MGMSSGSGSKSRVALSEINVTPLVDVMLVLLIMFMVTAPLMQQGLEVNLPETTDSGVMTQKEPLILVIQEDQKILIGKTEIPYKALQTRLQSIFSTRSNKQIYLQADKSVSYGYVANIMAEIRAAGIFNIGLVTIPKN